MASQLNRETNGLIKTIKSQKNFIFIFIFPIFLIFYSKFELFLIFIITFIDLKINRF